MKRLLLSSISLGVLAVGTQAHAQSSVTLYGLLDTGIAYVHNSSGQTSQWAMLSGNLAGTRWGLRGNEDLGGGLKAIFQLENGFDISNGRQLQNSRLFGRQAFVGLASDQYGTLTLGRQYDPVTDQVQPLTADITFGGIFATPGDIDNYDDSARFNNAVKWTSPVYMGLQAEGMYSFGNTPGSVGSGQTWSGALGYNNGPIGLAAGYIHIDNGNATLVTRASPTASSADSLTFSVINDGYTTARSINIARAAGTYTVGPLTAGAGYSFSTYNKDSFSTFVNNEKFHDVSVFATYQLTPPLLLGAGYNYLRALGDSSAKYHSFALGADYSLSKRTDVYATFGYSHAIGEQRALNGTLVSAEASIGSYGIPSGAGNSTQEIAIVGIRHRF